MISIQNVKKKYSNGRKGFYALNDVSLQIDDGEFIAITGKSGSGKSTLLNLIGTLDRATSGNIFVDGKNISKFSGKRIAEYRNKTVGFVFQSFYLEPSYTVYDNVALPLVLAGHTKKRSNRKRVEAALEEVGLANKIKERARDLSGGEQQRVAIARAIVNDPRYILADEPCGNLDTANSENIMRILAVLHDLGKTVIMVTHDPEDAEKAERVVTMSDGKIVSDKKNKPPIPRKKIVVTAKKKEPEGSASHPAAPVPATISVARPSVPAAKPAVPAAKPAVPTAKPVVPAAKPAVSAAKPAVPVAKPAVPAKTAAGNASARKQTEARKKP